MTGGALSAEEAATWSAIKRLSSEALAAVGRDIEAATGLSGADFGILTRLEDLGGGSMGQAALLASLGWEKSRLSHQLTRMEARGLVERRRGERRAGEGAGKGGLTVHLLGPGRERVAEARPVHAEAVRTYVLRHIDPDEARTLVTIVGRLSAPGAVRMHSTSAIA